jgi:ribonuclease HI
MDKRATIFTDSQIALDRLQNNNIHSHFVKETRRKLTEMKTGGWKTTLGWVKAHTGNWGNELADKLAKKAAFNKTILKVTAKSQKA